jgi:hypothetical protein
MKRGPSKGLVSFRSLFARQNDANMCVRDGRYIQQLEDRITLLESNAQPAVSPDSSSTSPSNIYEPVSGLRRVSRSEEDEDEVDEDGSGDGSRPKKKPRRWLKCPPTPNDDENKRALVLNVAPDGMSCPADSAFLPRSISSLPTALETLAEHAARHDREPSLEEARVAVRSCLEAAVSLALLVTRLPLKNGHSYVDGEDASKHEDLETLVDSAGFCLRHYSRSTFGESPGGGALGPHPLALGKTFISCLSPWIESFADWHAMVKTAAVASAWVRLRLASVTPPAKDDEKAAELAARAKDALETVESLALAASSQDEEAIYLRVIAPFARAHAGIRVEKEGNDEAVVTDYADQLAKAVADRGYLGPLLEWAGERDK